MLLALYHITPNLASSIRYVKGGFAHIFQNRPLENIKFMRLFLRPYKRALRLSSVILHPRPYFRKNGS